ncbi:MAG: peptide chain release factor N(5)-glutamine methyltransferase [Ruminococcus sp.]|jgi:release factor glutamine methyltransferase|nr:peptide chain release factor N(5)-glutamine methyltransferase [Ruminococcus sp.]
MKYGEILKHLESQLRSVTRTPEEARHEAIIIAEDIGEMQHKDIINDPDAEILPGRLTAMNKVVHERLFEHKPLQYIIGHWEFYGLDFKVNTGVLIPRPETELLIELTKSFLKVRNNSTPMIIDLCTGSGCIAITLKTIFPGADVRAVENSTLAFPFYNFNEKKHGVSVPLVRGDVTKTACLESFRTDSGSLKKFDVIVCNPPYLSKADMHKRQAEIKHEPEVALYGGFDGLDFYRLIVPVWKNSLAPDGMMLFEIGEDQALEVKRILRRAGFNEINVFKDFAGNDRAVMGRIVNNAE